MFSINDLPPKGIKRETAIIALCDNENNGEVLLKLANTERGKCKLAAQKALAQFDYPPASALWKKLAKGKTMGESVFANSCSDCVSEQIAPNISQFLSAFLVNAEHKPIDNDQLEKLRFCISIMLGKASEQMLSIYRFIAENNGRFASIQQEVRRENENPQNWDLGGFLQIWDATPYEMEKIFPLILTASLIKNQDIRLMELADDLYAKYGGAWLIPVFMKAILTLAENTVYDKFSPYLYENDKSSYIMNTLGMISYNDYPKDFTYERNKPVGYFALVFWGNIKYGAYDTRFVVDTPVNLDKRWLYSLAKNKNLESPKVAWQCYNRRRGGILYESYDEMFLGLLPEKTNDEDLRNTLYTYFNERSKIINVEESISVYKDAIQRFQL